jgi:hypothetical protein
MYVCKGEEMANMHFSKQAVFSLPLAFVSKTAIADVINPGFDV